MWFCKICILVFLLHSTVISQSSQTIHSDDAIAKCFSKYFPPVFVGTPGDNGIKQKRCSEPNPELCDLSYGISVNNREGVRCLVEAGFDFNVESGVYDHKHIPISRAAFIGAEMLSLIFESKVPVNVDVESKSGETTLRVVNLFSVLRSGLIHKNGFTSDEAYRSLEFLLSKGANPNMSRDGETPLMLQASSGKAKFVELLLRFNANPDLQSHEGETALMMSADDPDIIQLLLGANANIYLKDKKGKSAIFHAIENCQPHKIEALLKQDPQILESVNNKGVIAYKYLKKQSSFAKCHELRRFVKQR